MQDVVCSKCGFPIRDGFCGLGCDGKAEGVTVVVAPARPGGQMNKRLVRLTIEVIGETNRDGWQWGDGVARNLAADLRDQADGWFVAASCIDVEDPAKVPAPEVPK